MSELFDAAARQFLARAYAHPGQWAGTRLGMPSVRQIGWAASQGINVLGTDQWGRDRWAAAFIRAIYYQHKWYWQQGKFSGERRLVPNPQRSIRYELGRMKPALGIIPRGRAVRIISVPGGQAAANAAGKMPASRRIYTENGPGARWADPALRDW